MNQGSSFRERSGSHATWGQGLASRIFVVRPASFSYNAQTEGSNKFQQRLSLSPEALQAKALQEFDGFVHQLRETGVDVACLSDMLYPHTPDSIFPNNWVSFHPGGRVVLYPMMANNRRQETKKGFLRGLVDGFGVEIKTLLDLRIYAAREKYLESTGSMVLDHAGRLAYVCLSERSHPEPLEEACTFLGFEPVTLRAFDAEGFAIYHTNVLMSVGDDYAVICEEALHEDDRERVMSMLKSGRRNVISISQEQMAAFAANILQVRNRAGEKVILMSQSAYDALEDRQLELLGRESRLVPIPIPTIESAGGGSIRCMIAEIY